MAASGQSSITVAVRVRPFTIREAASLHKQDDSTMFLGDGSLVPTPKLHQRGLRSVVKVVDDRCLVFDPPEDNPVQRFGRSVVPTSKKVKDQVFAFDRVFDENTTQSEVYEGTTKNLLDSVLDGYNATVFAYGATGCGKTHTITGTPQQPGIIFLTMQELFEKIEERKQDKKTELSLSYLEIYNETIRDLLVPGGSHNKGGLMLREDSNQAVTVAGLTSHHPKDVHEVMDMIVQGNEYRTVSPTEANATSSRSHAVIQINIAQKDRNADVNEPHTLATLSIIDLAGSERASVTKNRGERLTEGANINKSLLALGGCINALCDRRQKAHVPYRNSKLTRLLKFSLGGNCKTVMIVCVSPSSAHFDESQNTLRYANRAKNIQTKVTRNVFNVNRHVKDFLVKIDEQMALINELKAQQKDTEKIFFAKFQKQCGKRGATAKDGIQRLRTAYENSSSERQERIVNMKKLKVFERRISLLSGWIAAFDMVCDQRGDEDSMPQSLSTIRKTAQGVMIELENSRRHMQQKLEKSTWERSIDTALFHSLKQLDGGDGADNGEISSLEREAELLKADFHREAYREVLEQDRSGDAAMVQMLLTAQFEILSSLSDIVAMDEETAVEHAKETIHRLLQTGFTAAAQVVKPDGPLPVVDAYPPTRKGTPKKKKTSGIAYVKPVPMVSTVSVPGPSTFAAPIPQYDTTTTTTLSPIKSSPRRHKALGATKKGVSFSPAKKPKSRGVRWRDDETESGTLADFEKTPQKFSDSGSEHASPDKTAIPPPAPVFASKPSQDVAPPADTANRESSLSPDMPEPTLTNIGSSDNVVASKPSRFQAGFLSKTRSSISHQPTLSQEDGSPIPTPPSLRLRLNSNSPSSDSDKTPPFRSLDVGKAGNVSPTPTAFEAFRTRHRGIPPTIDENKPPPRRFSKYEPEDESTDTFDTQNLRSALHSAKKERFRRTSLMAGTAASKARRVSSVGSLDSGRTLPRPSLPSALASTSNGISRARRGSSADRWRSPPMTCTPPEWKGERSFTPGQARRMNMGGNLGASPQGIASAGVDKSRRMTIGSVGGQGPRRLHGRQSLALR